MYSTRAFFIGCKANLSLDRLVKLFYTIRSDQIAETREACDRRRVLRPLLFSYIAPRYEGEDMSKPFLSYEDQLHKLESDKGLIVSNKDTAKVALKNLSYYALIGGYKHPFIDIHTRRYIGNTTFEDIVALQQFDEELRELFFKYLCRVEQKMRSMISYQFTMQYGEAQSEYLKNSNYNNVRKYQYGIQKLINMLSNMANVNTDHPYLVYQRNKYHNIPLWVLVNTLTFGQISKMYTFLPQKMQGDICKNFEKIKKDEMIQLLKVLTLFRNVCAHNERLFSFHTYLTIPYMNLHKKLEITKTGTTYDNGKDDLFAVVIGLRYLLDRDDFAEFKKRLIAIIRGYHKRSNRLAEDELLRVMGFPNEWTKISRFGL